MSAMASSPPFGVWTAVILTQIRWTESTLCLKRDEIEYRDGNVYECTDPNLPACCETDTSFTCCEEPWTTVARNQFWVFLVVAIVVMCGLCVCWHIRSQPHVFRAPTARDAALSWREKITSKFSRKSNQSKGKFDLLRPGRQFDDQ